MQGKNLSGWKKERPDHRDLLMEVRKAKRPLAADLKSICPVVENQGGIGSCTANSATSMMESLYNKKLANSAPQLSRLFLYYATRVWTENVAPTDDSGCYIRDVLKTMAKQGVCLEKTWPYNDPETRYAVEPPQEARAEALNHQILSYKRCNSLNTILSCLAEGYVCVGGFSVPENMMSTACERTGLVDFPGKREKIIGGHAVLFVGYDDVKRLLTFQNSWGSGWGKGGFGYLPYDFVVKGLADDFWTVRTQEMETSSAEPAISNSVGSVWARFTKWLKNLF